MRHRRNTLATVVVGGLLVSAAAGIAFAQPRTAASAPKGASASDVERPWSAAGGDIGIRWNHDLAGDLGMRVVQGTTRGQRASDGSERFSLQDGR